MYVHMHVHSVVSMEAEALVHHGTGVTGGCEPLAMDAGTHTPVFGKSRKCS